MSVRPPKTPRRAIPRVLWKRPAGEGAALGRIWRQLERELGPFTEVQRWEAARICQLRLAVEERTREWLEARRRRDTGKGRRPNREAVERLEARRDAAEDRLASALDRLRALTAGAGNRQRSGAELLADVHRAIAEDCHGG